jgi:site-specific DNA-methyltransferase (adenine-specific)
MPKIELIQGDCLEKMRDIPDGSIDMILCDPPYGTTACKWDSIIPLKPMWEQLKRIIKPNGAIVMTASQPFTTTLIASNMKMFRYCWVWDKKKAGNIFLAKIQPMKVHEDIVVFGIKTPTFYPIMVERDKVKTSKNYGTGAAMGGDGKKEEKVYRYTHKNPTSIIEASNASQKGKIHPTQKPVALMEYLIKTYTNEGETVLDFTMGSGTTGVACKKLNRNFIGIELDSEYFKIAEKRINENL